MTQGQVQQIIDTLNHAAGADWTALVRQQFLAGIGECWVTGVFLVVGLVAIVPLTIGIKRARREFKRTDVEHVSDYTNRKAHGRNLDWWYWNFLSLPSGALVLTGFFVTVFLAPDALNHLLDPAAYAIQQLPGFGS